LAGRPVEVTYRIKGKGCGPVSVKLNGVDLHFTRENNPYRSGAARLSMDAIIAGLTGKADQLAVLLG
jgi:1,2-beta-oligoglucan phosphorylase